MEDGDKKRDYLLPASILIAAVLITGALIYSTGLKNTKPETQSANLGQNTQVSGPQIDSNDTVLGDASAAVTVIEFGDFQCPYCAKFYKEIELPLIEKYIKSGKVKMVYKPLAFLDNQSQIKESQDSVNAVKCAQEQGKFWEYHDAIFQAEYAELQQVLNGKLPSNEGNGNLNRTQFEKIASDLKINVNQFLSCYDSKKHQNDFQQYMNEAKSIMSQGISTPSVFINGQPFQLSITQQGQFDFTAFSAAIDTALNTK